MDKVKIPHTGVDQSFEGRKTDPLHNPGPQEACIIRPNGASPGTASTYQNRPEQVQMSFPPYPCFDSAVSIASEGRLKGTQNVSGSIDSEGKLMEP